MNISNNGTETRTIATSPSQPPTGLTASTQIIYSILASTAIIGNTLVILVFLQDKRLLRKSYNIIVLSLAVADVLTAINLITNPALVLGGAFPYPTNPVLGDIFCRIIWSRGFLFQLVVFSAYICLALVIERWYAVVRPFNYNDIFSKKRTLVYIFLVWLWSLLICPFSGFEVEYVSSYLPTRPCRWQSVRKRRALIRIIQVFFNFFPSFTMFLLFIHLVYKTSKFTVASAESRAKMRGKITRMVGIASLMLIICFAPGQTFYKLAMAGIARMESKLHHFLSLLAFVSSCLNPFINGMSNRNYRRGYRKLLGVMMCCKISKGGAEIAPMPHESKLNLSERRDTPREGPETQRTS